MRTKRFQSEADIRAKAIRAQFPDVYYVAGIGWCGPQWEAAQAAWDEFRKAVR